MCTQISHISSDLFSECSLLGLVNVIYWVCNCWITTWRDRRPNTGRTCELCCNSKRSWLLDKEMAPKDKGNTNNFESNPSPRLLANISFFPIFFPPTSSISHSLCFFFPVKMRGFLIVAILSVATGQPLFFKPQQQDKVNFLIHRLNYERSDFLPLLKGTQLLWVSFLWSINIFYSIIISSNRGGPQVLSTLVTVLSCW